MAATLAIAATTTGPAEKLEILANLARVSSEVTNSDRKRQQQIT